MALISIMLRYDAVIYEMVLLELKCPCCTWYILNCIFCALVILVPVQGVWKEQWEKKMIFQPNTWNTHCARNGNCSSSITKWHTNLHQNTLNFDWTCPLQVRRNWCQKEILLVFSHGFWKKMSLFILPFQLCMIIWLFVFTFLGFNSVFPCGPQPY